MYLHSYTDCTQTAPVGSVATPPWASTKPYHLKLLETYPTHFGPSVILESAEETLSSGSFIYAA